jgi:hypothetical protein
MYPVPSRKNGLMNDAKKPTKMESTNGTNTKIAICIMPAALIG